jgi:hypothetical protein
VQVAVVDDFGNHVADYTGCVHLACSDLNCTLPARHRFTRHAKGVHTFDGIILKTAGRQTLTVADSTVSSLSGHAATLVHPGPAAIIRLEAPPQAIAGRGVSVQATFLDAFGNVAIGQEINFTSSDPGAQLSPADPAADGGANPGVVRQRIAFQAAGNHTVTACVGGSASMAAAATVHVVPAPAVRFLVSAPPGHRAGVGFPVTVTALDDLGQVVTAYRGTVRFSSSDPVAGLPDDYAFTSVDLGRHTFYVKLNTAGSQTILVSDTVSRSIQGSLGKANPSSRGAAPASGCLDPGLVDDLFTDTPPATTRGR